MSGVRRVYVEKKEPFAVAARQLKEDIEGFLGIEKIRGVRILMANLARRCEFIEQGTQSELREQCGLTPEQMSEKINDMLNRD